MTVRRGPCVLALLLACGDSVGDDDGSTGSDPPETSSAAAPGP